MDGTRLNAPPPPLVVMPPPAGATATLTVDSGAPPPAPPVCASRRRRLPEEATVGGLKPAVSSTTVESPLVVLPAALNAVLGVGGLTPHRMGTAFLPPSGTTQNMNDPTVVGDVSTNSTSTRVDGCGERHDD